MPPAPWAVPEKAADLYAGYLEWLASRGVGNRTFLSGARGFLVRFPEPQAWADLALEVRLRVGSQVSPFLNFLMFHGHLHPGYDFLLERKLHAVLRDAALSPLGPDLARFAADAEQLGYSVRARTGMASEVAARVLIQSGRPLSELRAEDLADFEAAISDREARNGRDYKHYRSALYASRAVIYHLGAPAEPAPKRSTLGRWSWERHLDGVNDTLRRSMVAYLQAVRGHPRPLQRVGHRQRARPLRAVPGRQLPGADNVRGPRPPPPHRALPVGGGRRLQPSHRRGDRRLHPTQPHTGRGPDARRHGRVGMGGSAPTPAHLRA